MKQHPKYENLLVGEDGRIYSKIKKKFLRPSVKPDTGYAVVYVYDIGKLQRVHRLVAETYLQNSEFYGQDVNHKDGNKQNNSVENLEWCTRSYNIIHAKELGLNKSRGETHFDAIYSEDQIREVCKLLEQGFRNQDIADMTGVHKDTVSDVRGGRRWKHVSRDYDLKRTPRNTRLSVEKVDAICKSFSEGATIQEVMDLFGVSEKIASNIYYRVTNKAVSCKFKW